MCGKMVWKAEALVCLLLAVLVHVRWCDADSQACRTVGPRCSLDKRRVEVCYSTGKYPLVADDCEERNEICQVENGKILCKSRASSNPVDAFKCSMTGEFPDITSEKDVTYVCNGKEKKQECKCSEGFHFLPIPGLPCVRGNRKFNKIKCTPGLSGFLTYADGVDTQFHFYCVDSNTATAFLNPMLERTFVSYKNNMESPGKTCQDVLPYEK